MKVLPGFLLGFSFFMVAPSASSACGCVTFQTFEESAKHASIVITGRVVSIGESPTSIADRRDPTNVQLEVASVAKGDVPAGLVTVWNPMAGTSCGGDLQGFAVGTRLTVALTPIESVPWAPTWEMIGFVPPAGDFVLAVTGCGTAFEVHAEGVAPHVRDR